MKSTFLILLSFLSLSVFAQPLTHTQITLTKNSADQNGLNYLAAPLARWCQDTNTVVEFGSFEAAAYVEALENGLYLCDGKFVTGPFQSPVQIFAISDCKAQNADDLKNKCQ